MKPTTVDFTRVAATIGRGRRPFLEVASFTAAVWLAMVPRAMSGPQEIAVLVVNNEFTPMWKDAHIRVFDRANALAQIEENGTLKFWSTDHFGKYRGNNSFRGQFYVVSSDGKIESTGFASYRDKKAFDQYVQDAVDRRLANMPEGIFPTVETNGDIKTIRTPPYVFPDNPQLKSLGGEAHLRYVDGIVVSRREKAGFAKLKAAPMRQAARLAKLAKGKMWYVLFRPQVVPAANRSAALSVVAGAANVGLQRRDSESSSSYEDRRLISDTQLQLLKSLAFDVLEFHASTEWPSEADEPFTLSAELIAKKGSRLSKLISQLRTSNSVQSEGGNLGWLKIAFKVPSELRPVAWAAVRRLVSTGDMIGLKEATERGDILLSARLDKDRDGISLVAQSPIALKAEDINALARRFALQDDLEGQASLRLNDVDLAMLRYRSTMIDDSLSFGLSSGNDLPSLDQPLRINKVNASQPLLELSLDLKPLVANKDNDWLAKFLRSVEKVYTRRLSPQNPLDEMLGRPHKDLDSLLHFAKPDGDWTLSAKLQASRNKLTLRIRVGADLHAFWRVRQQLR